MTGEKNRQKAVALKYEKETDSAPKVIAKGKGKLAEKIIKIARENDIYIHNDPDLIEVLSHLDLNEEIPPDLYVCSSLPKKPACNSCPQLFTARISSHK